MAVSGLEHLLATALRHEQERTLASPRMRYSLLASVLFRGMDLVYGRRRSLSKFKVLELIARVPYQAWELEREPFESVVTADYGRFESLADLFRQIGYDERVHKEESLAWMTQPRFA
jgi:hypothetical protein